MIFKIAPLDEAKDTANVCLSTLAKSRVNLSKSQTFSVFILTYREADYS